MENYRIFVEKHPRFRVEADSLRRELNTNLNLDIRSLRLLNVYDLFGFSRELLEKSRYSVFGEVVTDSVTDSCDLAGRKYIAVEYLPGQFDQRAASAVDCVRLIDPSAQVRIRSSKLLLFDDAVSDEDLARIRHYYINAVESREKNLDVLTDMEQAEVKPVAVLEGFTKMTDAELEPCCKRYGLAMNADDLREVVKYFRAEGRDPYETELRILDTYWSDHCRHTTFTTELEGITVEESFAKDEIEDSLAPLPAHPPRTGPRAQEHLPDGHGDHRRPLPAQERAAGRPRSERREQCLLGIRRCRCRRGDREVAPAIQERNP